MRIYLIGMPGSGKSSVGKELASKIGYEFIDLDNYIEKQAFMFVDEIFQNYGEKHFRKLEEEALKEIKNQDNIVVATGGGIVVNKNNKELMDGPCIYLNVNLSELSNRIVSSDIERPLLRTKSIDIIYAERKDLYDYFKDYEVLNDNLDNTINKILEIVNENKNN